jgi:hypothetical protein
MRCVCMRRRALPIGAAPPARALPQVHALQQRLALGSQGSPLLALQEAAEALEDHLAADLVA